MRMRKSVSRFLVFAACCGAALLGSQFAAAKERSQPAPDWAVDAARTPTPANVGDASAVILLDDYLITVDEQNHAVERERYAVRILKPQGSELDATFPTACHSCNETHHQLKKEVL